MLRRVCSSSALIGVAIFIMSSGDLPMRRLHLLAKALLLLGEGDHRLFEEARHQHLHAVAVEADQLAQEGDRQHVLPVLVLLLEDDLGQHRTGDVLAGLGVVDDEILALLDHLGEVFERHVGGGAGVVEPAVGVFLDDRRSSFVAMSSSSCHRAPE